MIVPYVEFPPTILFTVQVTFELPKSLTVAENCLVVEVTTVAELGVTDIELEPDDELSPLPPHEQSTIRRRTQIGYEYFKPLSAQFVTYKVETGLVTPSLLAVTSAVPAEMPLAMPFLSMVATPE